MSKQYRILGVIISLAIGLAILPIKLTSEDLHSGNLFLAARTIRYTFTAGILAFLLHLYLNRTIFAARWIMVEYILRIIVIALIICLTSIVVDVIFNKFVKESSFTIAKEDLNWYLVILRCLLVSTVQFFVVFYLQLVEESQRRRLEIEKLNRSQLEANLSNLKEQMNPHFLFNTLNTLSAITNDVKVKDYVSEIANVYRYMLIHNKLNLVPLESELSFINSYLYIIKTRFGNSLNINIRIDECILPTKIPPLSLQLLLENAIKHNVASLDSPLAIDVYNDSENIIVSNSLLPKKTNYHSTGVGLNNLLNRYQLLFKQDIIIEQNTAVFSVKLPIIKS